MKRQLVPVRRNLGRGGGPLAIRRRVRCGQRDLRRGPLGDRDHRPDHRRREVRQRRRNDQVMGLAAAVEDRRRGCRRVVIRAVTERRIRAAAPVAHDDRGAELRHRDGEPDDQGDERDDPDRRIVPADCRRVNPERISATNAERDRAPRGESGRTPAPQRGAPGAQRQWIDAPAKPVSPRNERGADVRPESPAPRRSQPAVVAEMRSRR